MFLHTKEMIKLILEQAHKRSDTFNDTNQTVTTVLVIFLNPEVIVQKSRHDVEHVKKRAVRRVTIGW